MAHLLAPIAKALQSKTPPTRIVALDGSAGDGRKPGSWQPIGTGMRVMALRSSHSPPLALKLCVAFQEINLPVYLWRGGFVPEDLKVRLVSRPGSGGGSTDFGHLCDTLGGSSGSPVLDRQSGAVVGLHHLGIPVGAVDPVNQAVHIGLVLEDVRTRLPALHSEITTP